MRVQIHLRKQVLPVMVALLNVFMPGYNACAPLKCGLVIISSTSKHLCFGDELVQ